MLCYVVEDLGDSALDATFLPLLVGAGDEAATARIAAMQGYLSRWRVIGPFPSDRNVSTTYPPEWEIDFDRKYEAYVHERNTAASVGRVSCGGVSKQSIVIRPPSDKSIFRASIATYLLDLPQRDGLTLTFSVGLSHATPSADGARFEARLGGKKVFEDELDRPVKWHDARIDVSAFAGRRVALELVANLLEETKNDDVAIGEPRVISGGETVIDVTKLTPPLPVRVSFGDKELPSIAWEVDHADTVEGELDLVGLLDGQDDGLAYAVADVRSPVERKVRLTVQASQLFTLWQDGKKLAGKQVSYYWQYGEVRQIDAVLPKGVTRFFMKAAAGHNKFHFRLRISDAQNKAVGDLTNATP